MTTPTIKEGRAAKLMVKRLLKKHQEELAEWIEIIEGWLKELNSKVKCCFTLSADNIVASFVIISKMDFDPLKDHTNPFCLNLIFTFPHYRRQGHARRIARRIAGEAQISAYCSNEESINMLKVEEYTLYGPFGFGLTLVRSHGDPSFLAKNLLSKGAIYNPINYWGLD